MVSAISYGIGALAFFGLIVLMVLNRRPSGFGQLILLSCTVTALWATLSAVQAPWTLAIAHLLEIPRNFIWLFVMAKILADARGGINSMVWSKLPFLVLLLGAVALTNELRFVSDMPGAMTLTASQVFERIVIAIFGILVVENLLRNTTKNKKWHIVPLCIAMASLFAYDLFVFADAIAVRHFNPDIMAGRGVILALIAPLLVLTMTRNPDWRIDVHVSRGMVFHTATLFLAGIFLVAAAGIAFLIAQFPGEWVTISQMAFLSGCGISLLIVLYLENLRSQLRRTISENFFSTRYDYRVEWMRCITTLSSSEARDPLKVRAVRVLADAADSPGGALWLRQSEANFGLEQLLNVKFDSLTNEPAAGSFIARFKNGETVQDLAALRARGDSVPSWASGAVPIWLAVPLIKVDELIGFVVLAPPRAPNTLNWELSELLLAIGQQAASYLAEEKAASIAREAQAILDYSRKFAFVGHDIKNVAGQLAMIIANARNHGDRADFREDIVRGLESSVRRLHSLLDKLKPNADLVDCPEIVDPRETVSQIAHALSRRDVQVCAKISAQRAQVIISATDLHAILTHLVTNAIEASTPGESVEIRLQADVRSVVIDVVDRGCGMSPDFVRNSLFVPRRSTKTHGHGMGAYQARELVRASKGELEVISAVGRGTTVRIRLFNMADTAQDEPSQNMAQP